MTNTHSITPAALLIDAAAPRPGTLRDVITTLTEQMAAEGAFAVLSAEDARVVAAIVSWEITRGDEAAGLRERAAVLLDGEWCWTDRPVAVAHALTAAAYALDAL